MFRMRSKLALVAAFSFCLAGLSALAQEEKTETISSKAIGRALQKDLVLNTPIAPDGYTEPEASPQIGINTVYFDLDSAKLRPESMYQLDEVVVAFRDMGYEQSRDLVLAPAGKPREQILIEGHTCDLGTDEHNIELSKARANAVRSYLVEHGLNPAVFQLEGWGEARPLEPNVDEKHRAQNRRVNFVRRVHQSALQESSREVIDSSESLRKLVDATFTAKALSEGGKIYANDEIDTLRSGDQLRAEFTVNRGCYAYVFIRNASEAVQLLFPPQESTQSLWVNPGSTWAFPARGQGEWFTLDDTLGKEVIYVIATREPVVDFKGLTRLLLKAGDTLTAKDLESETKLKNPELHMLAVLHK